MKKQKIALGKLALNKERIARLDAELQGNVVGGAPISVNIPCQVTLQINCQQTIVCVTRQVVCRVTRTPLCVPVTIGGGGCPPQSLVCNTETFACGDPGGL